jgi:hypothetical protein
MFLSMCVCVFTMIVVVPVCMVLIAHKEAKERIVFISEFMTVIMNYELKDMSLFTVSSSCLCS